MSDKVICPQCGKKVRIYDDGSLEKHKIYDSKRKTVFSICEGKPPQIKKVK